MQRFFTCCILCDDVKLGEFKEYVYANIIFITFEQKELANTMEENTALASRYRRIYNCLLLMRDTIHNLIDRKILLEYELQDHKQVIFFHGLMNYLKYASSPSPL